jgi:DNA-binding IclR family transcriptional regulator
VTYTTTYTLYEDDIAVLLALQNSTYLPDSCQGIAEDARLGVNRTRRTLWRLVELRLVTRFKGAYGRIRYDLTSLGKASSI